MFTKEVKVNFRDLGPYTAKDGFGFVDVRKVQDGCETDSDAALRCGGWNQRRLTNDAALDPRRDVRVIRIDVPEFGTYRVDVAISLACDEESEFSLFAGRRNLIVHKAVVKKDKDVRFSFYQAVTPYIPAMRSKRFNEKCVFISVNCADELTAEVSVAREDVPVIWVAGDSTLTDQNAGIPYYPYGSCCGWAQTLSRFIKNAAVCNLSHSGMTTNCFRDDGHFDIIKEMLKPGDFFIMQFGHNDQKRRNLSAFGGYKENLTRYANEIKALGAAPVICSPISRIPLEKSGDSNSAISASNGFYSLLSSYAKASEEAAKETDTLFADLHQMTFDKWTDDIVAARDYFMPGDITHTNEYGAVLISGFFMSKIRELASSDNAASMLIKYDNNAPIEVYLPSEDTKELPKELPGPDIFKLEPPYIDIEGIPEYEGIRKAFEYGLLDPCVMYLHPYATMPRAQLLMVMFKALRISGIRPYNGFYKDISFDEWDSGYIEAMLKENMTSKESDLFRPNDPLTYAEFADFLISFIEGRKDANNHSELLLFLQELRSRQSFPDSDFARKNPLLQKEKYTVATGNEISRASVYLALVKFMELYGVNDDKLPDDVEVHPVH